MFDRYLTGLTKGGFDARSGEPTTTFLICFAFATGHVRRAAADDHQVDVWFSRHCLTVICPPG